jgi:hypothetical protein
MVAERYTCSGNAKHYATPSYKRTSTLGGAFEDARIIARIGLVPAVVLTAFVAVCVCAAFLIILTLASPAASDAPASQQIASTFEARAGGKVQP